MHYISSAVSPIFLCPPYGTCTAQLHKFSRILPRATVTPSTTTIDHHHLLPKEKVAVIKSLEPWVVQSILPLIKPAAECWQPSDFLPNSSILSDDQYAAELQSLRGQASNLSDDFFVVLVGNMITEDALPNYSNMVNTFEGIRDVTGSSLTPWATWNRAWTAEENRHGDLLRTYLYFSARVDMRMIERTIHNLISSGMEPRTQNDTYMGFVYASFQERLTFISHGNTARLAKENGDPMLARICGVIASDEKRHENAYVKIVEKLLEVDTTTTMVAISDMMRKGITMPGHLMYDGHDKSLFNHYSAVAQRLGIFTVDDYADVLEFLVGRWRLEKLEGLTPEGRREQEYVCRLSQRIRKFRIPTEHQDVKFSWIYYKNA